MAKKSNRIFIFLGIAVVFMVGFIFLAKSKGWIGKGKAKEVLFATAKKGEIIEKVTAAGKVQPVDEVKISSEVSGEIKELLVKEGDSVTVGQLLVKVRPDNLKSALERVEAGLNTQKANLAQAKARVAQAKAQFIRAKAEFERNQKLFAQKVISEAEFETAKSSFGVAEADLDASGQSVEAARFTVMSAEASVKEARESLSLTSIFAPISGTVTKLSMEKGEKVVGAIQMSGTEIMRIANLNEMEVRINVNENDIIKVTKGDTAVIEVDSYTFMEEKFKGIVTSVANSANDVTAANADAVTEFEVRIRILNTSYKHLIDSKSGSPFRPGMTANADILTDKRSNILLVALSAVTSRSGNEEDEEAKDGRGEDPEKEETQEPKKKTNKDELKEVVFVKEGEKAVMKEVKTGISDFDNIEVLSGLKEGDQVISGPFQVLKKLKEGDKVEEKKKEKDKDEVEKAKN